MAGQIITLNMYSGPNINPRIERVLAEYNYQIAHKKIGKQKTEIVAVNSDDKFIPSDLVVDLSMHSTFIELKEMTLRSNSVPLQFLFHDKITREQLSAVLTEAQSIGAHVSFVRPHRRGFFIVQIDPSKIEALTSALRKYPFLDQFFFMRDNSRSEYLQDQNRNGITTVTIALKQPNLEDYVIQRIPKNIADVSIIRYISKKDLMAANRPAPAGGQIEVTMQRRYATVDALERALENLEQEQDRIEIYKDDDYKKASGEGSDAYLLGVHDQKYILKPREDRIHQVAIHIPNIEKKVYDYMAQRKVSQDDALFQFGLAHMRARIFALPLDIFGFRTAISRGSPSEFIYVSIPDKSMNMQVLGRILMDFHIYRLATNGIPDYEKELTMPSCESILVNDQKLLPAPDDDGDPKDKK